MWLMSSLYTELDQAVIYLSADSSKYRLELTLMNRGVFDFQTKKEVELCSYRNRRKRLFAMEVRLR